MSVCVLASSQSPTPQSAVKRGTMLVRAPSQSLAGPFGLNELGFYFYFVLFFFQSENRFTKEQ